MAPPTTPKTPSKGSKMIAKPSKGNRSATKSGGTVEKKVKRKRKFK